MNDTYGHDVGDIVLKETARRIKSCIRESDVAARMGGDEFTVLMTLVKNNEDVVVVAEKLISVINNPITISHFECKVGASIGVSIFPDNGDTPEKVIKKADNALYEVKRAGKNNFRMSD
ncbi:MAG: GGDEF domain-containing protein [Nitrospinae bacterium]|nr:GGDEF domain-containing protein [Nitrospinota bacterium]